LQAESIGKYPNMYHGSQSIGCRRFFYSWRSDLAYAFPLFKLIGRTLAKAEKEGSAMILIVPDWPTQVWYPQSMRVAVDKIVFSPRKNNLILPHRVGEQHPLSRKMTLMAILLKPRKL